MRPYTRHTAGFTMIEVIVALLLAGVLVVMTGFLIAPIVGTALQAREAADILHSSQLVMARLTREFTTITNVVSGTDHAITYDTLDSSGQPHRRSVAWNGTPGSELLLDGHVLADGVQDFALAYLEDVNSTITASWMPESTIIRLVLDMGAGSAYTNRFFPRNLGVTVE